jgi:hypothetical protein
MNGFRQLARNVQEQARKKTGLRGEKLTEAIGWGSQSRTDSLMRGFNYFFSRLVHFIRL